jgi:5,10-methenyltetrahydromethanopterin hydrogenase
LGIPRQLANLLPTETTMTSRICQFSCTFVATALHALQFIGEFIVSNPTFADNGNILIDEVLEEDRESNNLLLRRLIILRMLACFIWL